MSGIFGVINPDGRPLDTASLTDAAEAMAYWGPHGRRQWSEKNAGLGHLLLHNTPQSVHEHLPLVSQCGNLVLTACSRLDNRSDLLKTFGMPENEHAETPDSRLILNAYRKWGHDSPQYLLGDWAFAVWDRSQQELFLARDQFGHTGLYYYHDHRTFVFASSLAAVTAVPGVPHELNPACIAQMVPGYPRNETTPYRNVLRVLPARTLCLRRGQITQQQYWHPKNSPTVRFRRDEDYVEAFREIYSEAVRCRLRSARPAGVTLSGGLDSGSTAALAAQELRNRGQRLIGVTSVPKFETDSADRPGQFGDERPFVEQVRRHCGNIDVTYVTADNITPIEGIRQALDIYAEPLGTASNNFWLHEIMDAARRQDIGTLLTGHGGNLTVSYTGTRELYLASLLKRGRLLQYVSEIRRWQQIHQAGFLKTLTNQIVRSVVPSRFVRMRNRRRGLSDPLMLNPEFVRTLPPPKLSDRPELLTVHGNSAHRKLYASMGDGNNSAWCELGAAFGINVATPVYDIRVIEFCLGIPQDQYTRNGQRKLLIRRTMKGLLPDEVLWNERKGKQSADIIHRVREHYDETASVLKQLEMSSLAGEVLNLPRMKRVLEDIRTNIDPELSRLTSLVLLKGIMIGLFLERFEAPAAGVLRQAA